MVLELRRCQHYNIPVLTKLRYHRKWFSECTECGPDPRICRVRLPPSGHLKTLCMHEAVGMITAVSDPKEGNSR